jgi:thymidylate kinase
LQLAAMDPERYLVLDAQRPIIEIHQEITARISALLAKKS